MAYHGEGDWQGRAMESLRSVFSMHPETVLLVTRADSGIAAVADLKGILTLGYYSVDSKYLGKRYYKPSAKVTGWYNTAKTLRDKLNAGNPAPQEEYFDWYESAWGTTLSDSQKRTLTPAAFKGVLNYLIDDVVTDRPGRHPFRRRRPQGRSSRRTRAHRPRGTGEFQADPAAIR